VGPAVAGRAVVSKASGKCLSAPAGSDGTPVVLATCNGGRAQKWDVRADGTVVSMGLCLDLPWAATVTGTELQIANCNGTDAQQFKHDGGVRMFSRRANKCVDTSGRGVADGTPIVITPCDDASKTQSWVVK
jgi:hypothetical protein